MGTVIWQGVASRPSASSSSVMFTADPATGAIAQASTSGPVTFTPDAGYANMIGSFSSVVDFPPGSLPSDPAAAWAQVAEHLVILDPARRYTMVITAE